MSTNETRLHAMQLAYTINDNRRSRVPCRTLSINGVSMSFYHLPLEAKFPRAFDLPKGHPEWCQSVVGLMGSYDYVRT